MRHTPAVEALELRRLFAVDLTATITCDPTFITGGAGGFVRPQVTIRNAGDEPVRSIWTMRFVISPDPIIGNGNDLTIGSETRTMILPDTELVIRPGLILSFTPARGAYFVGVVLDTTGSVAESNEANNVAFTALPALTSFNSNGVLAINGTDADDEIEITGNSAVLNININGMSTRLLATGVTGLSINTGAGNDRVTLFTDFDATIDAGEGDDFVASGGGDDVIAGRGGRDRLFGGGGNDHIMGNANGDFLFGDAGDDTVSGNGGNDRITGGGDEDSLLGGAGNDFFFAIDGRIDTLSGNGGDDFAEADPFDILVSVTAV
ncbi:MAG: calcium-binding protein [Tepidisphaeraceae bacterium]